MDSTSPVRLKTSVVIPTKNNATTIKQCLSSLIPFYQQGYIDEIVVVDAHSTDGTLEIVKSFPVKLIFDEGLGPNFGREMVWRKTRGDLILFTDADTYVGDNFFPTILDYFSDDKVGIVGAYEKAVVTNRITKIVGEWWMYHARNLKGLLNKNPASWSIFQRLYQRIAWTGEKNITTAGPCFIVRRICIEATDGFGHTKGTADILLSRRITEKGWMATWWVEAPLYHHPEDSLKRLLKQRYRWGKVDAIMHRDSMKIHQRAVIIISRLGTPLVGLLLAFRYKNLMQLVLFPLVNYIWVIGYLNEWLRPKEKKAPELNSDGTMSLSHERSPDEKAG